MKCPKCGKEKQKILQSHPFGEETKRKRKCVYCDYSFITFEKAEASEEEECKD